MQDDIVYLEDPRTGLEDYRAILAAILNQAIDDYVILMHPKRRKKKYLQESFLDAVDMFFDDSYRMNNISNEYGEDMSLPDLICALRQTKRPNIEALKSYVVNKAKDHWSSMIESSMSENKEITQNSITDFVSIPQTIQVCGRVYRVFHSKAEENYFIDHDEQTVYLDLKASASTVNFCKALIDVMLHTNGVPLEDEAKKNLAESFYMLLMLNDCFARD